jgi:Zn-dependent protease
VPVDWRNLRRPKRDMIWVAAAGPGAILLMGLAWGLLVRAVLVTPDLDTWIGMPLLLMGIAGVFINTVLMVLNLLPLPPLDGGRVVTGLLPTPWAVKFARIEPYGIIILLLLLFTGALQWLIAPAFYGVLLALSGVTGLAGSQYLELLKVLMGG